MTLGMLHWGRPEWFWPALILVLVAVGLTWWSYRPGVGTWRLVAVGLRLLGVTALAACLVEPMWTGQRARPGANLFAVVADNSEGLKVRDRGGQGTRADELQRLLGREDAGWQAALEGQFEVRRFQFDARLQAVSDYGRLDFSGRSSALAGALRTVRERFVGRPLAGVLVFTDGIATDATAATVAETESGVPIYPVMLGRPQGVRDLALGTVHVARSAFEDAPVTVQAEVRTSGLAGERVAAELLDATGRVVAEQTLRGERQDHALTFRFRFKPVAAGLAFYRLRVRLDSERDPAKAGESSREATWLNNEQMVPVDRGGGPYRILYVGGRPNWEYRFLNRALQEDAQLQLVGLLRIALREPKFDFRGRAGETGNPLYRGFGNQAPEEVARYDQPVLIRLNTRDEAELQAGFPRTREELFAYHAVIVDDVEAGFFAPDQAAVLRAFVAERGGGFLMLGGAESFREGGYQQTPVGELLPVYLDRRSGSPAGPRKLQLAREGWLEAWARLRDNESDERARLSAVPAFEVFNLVGGVKPGASVISTASDADGGEQPALVTQRFGRGRSAALMVGDTWRWGMRSPETRQDMEKAWRQLARWLVSDIPARVELAVQEGEPGLGAGGVRFRVTARDAAFQPLDDGTVTVEVMPEALMDSSATNVIRLRAEASATDAGVYEASFVPRESGGYRVLARVTDAQGTDAGKAEAGWTADLAALEFQSLEPNRALLEAVARRSGGEVLSPDQLDGFVRGLSGRQAPVMEAWTRPLWHGPWLFLFALASLVAEWGLRRRKGLP